jgi:ABC-type antimicrobial peptide transport system permease subunit
MYYLFTIFVSGLEDFSRNKVRTLLTSLGILIGVLSVVLIIAFGLGLKKSINDQFESLGSGQLILFPGQVLSNGRFRGGGGNQAVTRFSEKDIENLKRLKELKYAIPSVQRSTTVIANGKTEPIDMVMSMADIFIVRNFTLDKGRLFTQQDDQRRAKVAVLGYEIARKLFDESGNALGKKIKVEQQTFTVVGTINKVGSAGFGGPDYDNNIFIPFRTGFVYNTDKKFSAAVLVVRDPTKLEAAKTAIAQVLERDYKKDDFSIVELSQIQGAVTSIFGILSSVLTGIAAISLVVGGVGIMNIMYVSVSERIKEIGVRRALGARRADILWQFLIEAVTLSLFGGLLGITLAFLIVAGIQSFFPAYINIQSVALAVGVSSLIGVVFGVFPARKASLLSPIEAIRYE